MAEVMEAKFTHRNKVSINSCGQSQSFHGPDAKESLGNFVNSWSRFVSSHKPNIKKSHPENSLDNSNNDNG